MWLLLFVSGLAWSLPEMTLKSEWTTCQADTDCMVAGDGCRSCGKLQFINQKFKDDYIKQDNDQRIKARIVLACEACSTSHIKLKCLKNKCVGEPKTSP